MNPTLIMYYSEEQMLIKTIIAQSDEYHKRFQEPSRKYHVRSTEQACGQVTPQVTGANDDHSIAVG